MDQLGPRKVVPLGAATVAVGALLFATGDPTVASIGRFLQGVGGVFALIGAAYIATTEFPASRAATLIGATQMFGMAGGSAGPVPGRPGARRRPPVEPLLVAMGVAGLAIAGAAARSSCRQRPEPAAARRTAIGRRRRRSRWGPCSAIRSRSFAA